jgi:hypothetical protein
VARMLTLSADAFSAWNSAGSARRDMHLDERLLGMAVELGERLRLPMQARWPIDPDCRQLCLSLDEPGPTAIGDALFVQHALTGDLLDFYDSHAPGELVRRGLHAAERLGPAALATRW